MLIPPVEDCLQADGAGRCETIFRAQVDNRMLVCIFHGHCIDVLAHQGLLWKVTFTNSLEMHETVHWNLHQVRLNKSEQKTVA